MYYVFLSPKKRIPSGRHFMNRLVILMGIAAIGIPPLFPAVEGTSNSKVEITGELIQGHAITITFTGPEGDEQEDPNPFLDYRLTVRFTQGNKIYRIPGYFAADGQAGESGATRGNQWRVHFVPAAPGRWQYTAEFVTGKDIAIQPLEVKGEPFSFNGAWGRSMCSRRSNPAAISARKVSCGMKEGITCASRKMADISLRVARTARKTFWPMKISTRHGGPEI